MPEVVYIHWNEEEAAARADSLRGAGFPVRHHSARGGLPLGDALPVALVISLDRLPSHGREIARWFWQAKKRQSIPLIFENGDADKLAPLQKQFPRATFCSASDLPAVLARALPRATGS